MHDGNMVQMEPLNNLSFIKSRRGLTPPKIIEIRKVTLPPPNISLLYVSNGHCHPMHTSMFKANYD